MKRVVQISVLNGQPKDGTGKVCVHLYVQDPAGLFVEPHVLHPVGDGTKNLEARPTRGRLACDPKRPIAPYTRNGVTVVTPRTDDTRAVTCPKCIATEDWKKLDSKLTAAQQQG
jgi:hypothetical protein